MPNIYDNMEQRLGDALRRTLKIAERADFCVGYFNLRGWHEIEELMERWQGGDGACCRLMIGMQERPEDELRQKLSLRDQHDIDNGTAARLKQKVAEEFRRQLMMGAPTNRDLEGLRRLSRQLREQRLVVKLFLRHKLHAKLYMLYEPEHPNTPRIGYLGSSNLTLAGLMQQGELNVDVTDSDATRKLEQWFNDRWDDRWCLDISQELAEIIEQSWARTEMLKPYYIYLKMAYHLSEDARAGLLEFNIPREFNNRLFDYQIAAVKIAARHLNRRGGVLIGDVVGLGKTLMATALARIMQDDYGTETLVLCPKNLVRMWKDYFHEYHIVGDVFAVSNVLNELTKLRRYRVLIIDESHNLRNREGKRYRAIKEYIEKNESKCILLSATPYNKSYLDLSAQLRLFLSDETSKDLGIRPEKLLSEKGEARFNSEYQCPVRSLTAFEKSEYPDDWRELMRHFMVRRTRSFIQEYYAKTDSENGRKYLVFSDGTRTYFPVRTPRTVTFEIDERRSADDPYARLFASSVIETINDLNLPRYGLGNYIATRIKPTPGESAQLSGLSKAGKRLMGFCRTNLFKRLESGGPAFMQSIERHILRNYIFLHAIEHDLDLPIGSQGAELLDTNSSDIEEDAVLADDLDADDMSGEGIIEVDESGEPVEEDDLVRVGAAHVDTLDRDTLHMSSNSMQPRTEGEYKRQAARVYEQYATQYRRRFKWIRPSLFNKNLKKDLALDARALLRVVEQCGPWDAEQDRKLDALVNLLNERHPHEKVLIFTQFADTVRYLERQLHERGIEHVGGATGETADPTVLAWRFSPMSNDKKEYKGNEEELRVLVATDVLSEGQNLQDAAIVVNYDLPWAIIRLIQRAGRVDRIGQRADTIYCYSFLPADGVERLIRLRERVQMRLQQNAEVVGTDEAFFEDESNTIILQDLYNEKSGVLDGEPDSEVDLASQAYTIWKSAVEANPRLKKTIEQLPNVVFSTKAHRKTAIAPEGVLVYMRTGEGNDSLAWIDRKGQSVTQSQLAILRAAECDLETPAVDLPEDQHELVRLGVEHIIEEETHGSSGQLGSTAGARARAYTRLKAYIEQEEKTLFPPARDLYNAVDQIYQYPLTEVARGRLQRQMRNGLSDSELAKSVLGLYEGGMLCYVEEQREPGDPQIICSLGLYDVGD